MKKMISVVLFTVGLLAMGQASVSAGELNERDLDTAIKAGDFGGYFTGVTEWLNQKVPASVSTENMKALLKDPVFVKTLDQRQLMVKCGVTNLNVFVKADAANAGFLAWLLKNTQVMEMFLESVGPTPISERDNNNYTVSVEVLDRWQKILSADPEAKEGICLKLAMATAIAPPHSIGAGTAKVLPGFLDRYKYFKAAQKNSELFPSFNNLTVWEYTKIVSSGASHEDLSWGREMIKTWRPDMLIKEQVFLSTSEVWRRNSPIEFDGTFKNVLAGGGKCGPRSSWTVFICQAWGIPAIGVGQPAHACAALKSAYPEVQPQTGSGWKVVQGRGWHVSRLEGTTGSNFVAAVEERAHAGDFSEIEHLRWLASTLAAKEQADAVMAVAGKIRESLPPPAAAAAPAPETDVNVEGVAKVVTEGTATAQARPEESFKAVPGTIHIEAETFASSFAEPAYPAEQKGLVYVLDCFTGGKQVNFQKNMKTSWVDYSIDVPGAGTYGMVARVAVVNREQILDVSCGTNKVATINIPNTFGLWTTTEPVDLKLDKGVQTLRISAPLQRGVAIRWFELRLR